jgi:hypothetical protein
VRTTLDIDDDVLQAAKDRARHQGTSAGRIISGSRAAPDMPKAERANAKARCGFRVCETRRRRDQRKLIDAFVRTTPIRSLLDVNVRIALLDRTIVCIRGGRMAGDQRAPRLGVLPDHAEWLRESHVAPGLSNAIPLPRWRERLREQRTILRTNSSPMQFRCSTTRQSTPPNSWPRQITDIPRWRSPSRTVRDS